MVVLYIILGILGLFIILVTIGMIISYTHKNMFDNHYTPHFYNDYPDEETGNWLPVKKVHNYVYDDKFHYTYGKTFGEKLAIFGVRLLGFTVVPFLLLFDGAVIYRGQRKLNKYSKQFKNGFISVCNHVYKYEFLMIREMKPFTSCYVPIWQEGAEGPDGNFYRAGGGVVLPHTTPRSMFYGFKELDKLIKEGKWVHIFPEQAGWFYYGGVRKFQNGTFKLAYDNDKPIVPFGISFRKRRGLWRLFGPKNKPCVTLSVGDPIFPNKENEKNAEVERLTNEARSAVMNLANIRDEEQNNEIKSTYNYYKYDASKSSF